GGATQVARQDLWLDLLEALQCPHQDPIVAAPVDQKSYPAPETTSQAPPQRLEMFLATTCATLCGSRHGLLDWTNAACGLAPADSWARWRAAIPPVKAAQWLREVPFPWTAPGALVAESPE